MRSDKLMHQLCRVYTLPLSCDTEARCASTVKVMVRVMATLHTSGRDVDIYLPALL